MSTLTALSLVLLGSTAASTINTREYRPNEHLMLVDCGIGLLPNGASTSREMAYYSGSYNSALVGAASLAVAAAAAPPGSWRRES